MIWRSPRSMMEGFVYFVEAVGADVIKIGFSGSVRDRFSTLDSSSPVPLVLLGTIPGGLHDERMLHDFFREARVRGEWFWKGAVLPFARRVVAADPESVRLILDDIKAQLAEAA